jgi:hypothetical protein
MKLFSWAPMSMALSVNAAIVSATDIALRVSCGVGSLHVHASG